MDGAHVLTRPHFDQYIQSTGQMKTYSEFLNEYNMKYLDKKDLNDIKDDFNTNVQKCRKALADYLVSKRIFSSYKFKAVNVHGKTEYYIEAAGHENQLVNLSQIGLVGCVGTIHSFPKFYSTTNVVYSISTKSVMNLNGQKVNPGFTLTWVNTAEKRS